ncbi:hypothetical protein [Oculatella sp. LEGE 06141]|uniref:hypothetical protein n=1 Tax=Oculatella sp. LEGE 06141 TaxID=1828648 RepID=UPI001D15583E|nr:hypothetical protein [Oculatella sp. LEGE 06141]
MEEQPPLAVVEQLFPLCPIANLGTLNPAKSGDFMHRFTRRYDVAIVLWLLWLVTWPLRWAWRRVKSSKKR